MSLQNGEAGSKQGSAAGSIQGSGSSFADTLPWGRKTLALHKTEPVPAKMHQGSLPLIERDRFSVVKVTLPSARLASNYFLPPGVYI